MSHPGGRIDDWPVKAEQRQRDRPPGDSLFSKLDVIHDNDSSRSAAMNMAIDEALLDTATSPTIRFYRWDHPALSFGYFGKFAAIEAPGRDAVRRWTGGGIVYHGEDLTYSMVIPANDPAFRRSTTSIYREIHQAICRALETAGVVAMVKNTAADKGPANERGYACFENPVFADVMSDGRKIAGAAQRRTRRGLLQQGSIQIATLDNDFRMRLAHQLADGTALKILGPEILARGEELANQKYGNQAWLRKW